MLVLKGVSKVYESNGLKQTALKKINLAFRNSEFAAILGPSGSGKTTLLNIIGGLDQYTKGDLIVNGRSTKKFKDKDWDAYRNHRIGFVFQSYNLIPHQTVLQNVRLALTLSGISKKESIRRAKHALREVGLGDEINKRPAQLSGGQMQRVAIARALVNDPEIVLADEPTGALDSETSLQIMDILKKVAKDRLVIMVTHNPELADKYATRIITLKDGQITSDSNPYTEEEEEHESRGTFKQHHTKMSYLTALSLSMKNLLTKKARTILIAIAGSIGIIGIALISAVSTGFQNYIDTIEHDTLTSYPLTLMEESTDITSILLSITGQAEGEKKENTVIENQELTGALGTVSHNDLFSFMNYLDAHKSELGDDIRLIEKQYNVDPLIYTIDKTGELAKLNPSDLFSSLIGDTSLLNNYSSLTSVFQQQELSNMQEESTLLAGRWPENYDELVISLRDPTQIPDLMTYSLGFHDTDKLNDILAKILSGEPTNESEAPLELSYDDLMNADLRLIPATETYRYNGQYNVYENMSDDESYMRNLFENDAEKLKIVGIITPSSSGMGSGNGNGIFYLPSLVTHIIEKAGETEIVKKQLAEPEVDIFTGKKFGEESPSFNFEFSDLVSVDEEAMQKAFGVTIDQNEIAARTKAYMSDIAGDIDTGTNSVPAAQNVLKDRLKTMVDETATQYLDQILGNQDSEDFKTFKELATTSEEENADLYHELEAKTQEITMNFLNQYMAGQDFGALEAQYGLPSGTFTPFYNGLLTGWAQALRSMVIEGMKQVAGLTGSLPEIAQQSAYNSLLGQLKSAIPDAANQYVNNEQITSAVQALALKIAEVYLQTSVLTKVGGLTQYLTSSFADSFHVDQSALTGAFHLKYTEDELKRLIATMFNQKDVTLSTNLSDLGYQNLDEPTRIEFYFTTFDAKTHFMDFLNNYNSQMAEAGEDDKVIEYSDTTGVLMSSVKVIVDAVSYVLIAFVSISLIVSSIMIGVITYISVYERKKEIGILRAMGASKHNISSIFNAETMIIGLLAGLFGVAISYILIPPINAVLHHFTGDIPLSAALAPTTAVILVILSVILTLIGGLIPAHSASKKDPVEALRSGD